MRVAKELATTRNEGDSHGIAKLEAGPLAPRGMISEAQTRGTNGPASSRIGTRRP